MKVLFGPGGTEGLGYDEGIPKLKQLNLDALEVEFTHSVHMKNDKAKEIGKLAKQNNITLSIHAPYFINLATDDKEKLKASKKRILDSCERGHHLGAKYIVFHAGFYQKKDKDEVFNTISQQIAELNDTIKDNNWNTILAPETTGKPSQFGSLAELLKIKKQTKSHLCIDFAHLRARNNGIIDYDEIFKKIKDLKHIHAHFSGIEWTEKGERRHLLTEEKDITPLLKQVIKHKTNITFINESPSPINDALKMKQIFQKLTK